jgi:hypothetical protein
MEINIEDLWINKLSEIDMAAENYYDLIAPTDRAVYFTLVEQLVERHRPAEGNVDVWTSEQIKYFRMLAAKYFLYFEEKDKKVANPILISDPNVFPTWPYEIKTVPNTSPLTAPPTTLPSTYPYTREFWCTTASVPNYQARMN